MNEQIIKKRGQKLLWHEETPKARDKGTWGSINIDAQQTDLWEHTKYT